MRALDRLEGILQGIVERPAALLGARGLQPLEIAAALTRALEAGAVAGADRVLVPDRYTVELHRADLDQISVDIARLEREFAGYLLRLAAERGLTLAAPVDVAMRPSIRVRRGAVRVRSAFSEDQGSTLARSAAAPQVTERAPSRRRPPPASAATAILEVLDAAGRVTHTHTLDAGPVDIGRRLTNGIALEDIEVSRRHARIDRVPPHFYVRDLRSTNGTLVNGRRLTGPAALADGDLIELGHTRLRFRQGG